MFQKSIEYIDIHNKLPSGINENEEIKKLNTWIETQRKNYRAKDKSMANINICNKWTIFINNPKYKKYFQSIEQNWNENFEKLSEYIDSTGKKPSKNIADTKSLFYWMHDQLANYKKNEGMMKNKKINNKWKEFVNNPKYKSFFKTEEDTWNENYQNLIEYLNEHKKKPTNSNKNTRNLAIWISKQIENYTNKERLMKNEVMYNKWTDFINNPQYNKYL